MPACTSIKPSVFCFRLLYFCPSPSSVSFFLLLYMCALDTDQDFMIKLGIKPCMHLWEISILSLNIVIIRPTKIMNRATKVRHIFRKQSTLNFKNFKKFYFKELISLSNILHRKKIRKIRLIFDAEKWLESTNFANLEEVVHNFGRFDDDMI